MRSAVTRASAGLLLLTLGGLVVGIGAYWAGNEQLASWAWTIPSVIVGVRLAWSIIRDLLAGEAGVDVIAILAIAGALALGESFAAAVIAVMLATGEALESYAEGQANRELTALLGRAPQDVRRYAGIGLEVVPIAAVTAGDRLLVRPGEVVPVDGVILGDGAVLDESALTGESRLVTRGGGDMLASGVVNGGGPFDMRATATADASTYAGIVRLVEQAGRSKAPFVRLADRYGLLFVPLTLAIAGVAWVVSGDPVRALAVLVVATPCPLLLAAPIAIVSGISRAARRGIIVKGGGPLETLARSRVLLFDKTGTLTAGHPRLASVEGPTDPNELLRLAAALEQASPHVLAAAIVQAAYARQLELPIPSDVVETPGSGVSGRVGDRAVTVGSTAHASGRAALPSWVRDLQRRAAIEGTTNVYISIDDQMAGAVVLDDPIRPETPRAVRSLRRAGFTRILMVTGDRSALADLVGAAVGLDGVLADRTPADKVEAVRHEAEMARGPIVMVGDGVNDAPALAVADVGVAMGARGATASSQAADIVITVDRLDRLAEAVLISRRSRSIALQSVMFGMGLSLIAMVVAAFGYLPVVAGALLQEAIDITVILNALRALRGGVPAPVRVAGWDAINAQLITAHHELASGMAHLRTTADRLDVLSPRDARGELETVDGFLGGQLLPHEIEEDRTIHPSLAAALGTDDAIAALHGTHNEIFRLARLFTHLVGELPAEGPGPDDSARPATGALRARRDPATAHGAGGGAVRVHHGRLGRQRTTGGLILASSPARRPGLDTAPRRSILVTVTRNNGRRDGGRPHPAVGVTVDVVALTIRDGALKVMLIERERPPFEGTWALPGAFVAPRPDGTWETLEELAARALAEESGVADLGGHHLEQLATFGAPDRDPRMRVISIGYLVFAPDLPEAVPGACRPDRGMGDGETRRHRHRPRPGLRSRADPRGGPGARPGTPRVHDARHRVPADAVHAQRPPVGVRVGLGHGPGPLEPAPEGPGCRRVRGAHRAGGHARRGRTGSPRRALPGRPRGDPQPAHHATSHPRSHRTDPSRQELHGACAGRRRGRGRHRGSDGRAHGCRAGSPGAAAGEGAHLGGSVIELAGTRRRGRGPGCGRRPGAAHRGHAGRWSPTVPPERGRDARP